MLTLSIAVRVNVIDIQLVREKSNFCCEESELLIIKILVLLTVKILGTLNQIKHF